jgi:glyoxylase-like metal-dependent hydrolase (beta-lactamase superfamily II)
MEFTTPDGLPVVGRPYEVADGVYLLRMPLPFRLDHINLYILAAPDGWTLIDCGLNNAETMAVWEDLFESFLASKPVKRILITHLHPDHIGLAAWLHEKTGAPLLMTGGEWNLARDLFHLPETNLALIRHHFARLGIEGEALESMVRQGCGFRRLVKKLPDKVTRVRDGDILAIGHRRWQIHVGRGHSPECACLWSEQDRVLIAGDHVLPKISPNISVLAIGPQNPLDDYLNSLDVFDELPCSLLLPAHGVPIRAFRERVAELRDHHRAQLRKLESSRVDSATVFECLPHLFKSGLPDHQLYFALGETAAHLVYLWKKGILERRLDGVWKFSCLQS